MEIEDVSLEIEWDSVAVLTRAVACVGASQ